MKGLLLVALLIQASLAHLFSGSGNGDTFLCDYIGDLYMTFCEEFESTDGFVLVDAYQEEGWDGQGLAVKAGTADLGYLDDTCVINPSDCDDGFTLSLMLQINNTNGIGAILAIGMPDRNGIMLIHSFGILSSIVRYGNVFESVRVPIPVDNSTSQGSTKNSVWFHYTLVMTANKTLEAYVDYNDPVDKIYPGRFPATYGRNENATLKLGAPVYPFFPNATFIIDNLFIVDEALLPDEIYDITDFYYY